MQRNVMVPMLVLAMLATAGFANTSITATTTLEPGPAVATAPPSAPVVRWEKFYDRNGNALNEMPPDVVGGDSLYFKQYGVTNTLYGSPKVDAPNPTPASCRSGFSFLDGQTRVGMDPAGDYIYEVDGTTLRRHSTTDGSYADNTISAGNSCCMTDGNYLYVPVGNVVYKYTLYGSLEVSTTINITPLQHAFSVVNDTVWCGTNSNTLYGYACSKFQGGSITEDAVWDLGAGSGSGVIVCWDGSNYYAAWSGFSTDTFKVFYPNRTVAASGTINIDSRAVMSASRFQREAATDSLYWKLYTGKGNFFSSPKAQDVTPARPTAFAWQITQSISCMTPDGRYLFEVAGTNLRRTDLPTGTFIDFTLANTSGGACATDGRFVYIPNGTTTRKYTLDGTLVSSTTTDYAPWTGMSTFGFGVANDTVWLTPAEAGTTWYGYACAKFEGGSITHDVTWTTAGGATGSAMTVAFDGKYYYMTWGGYGSNTFRRFTRDRTLYSNGTVTGDNRSVMCKAPGRLMIVSTDVEPLRVELAEVLAAVSGGLLSSIGTHNVQTSASFPATDWYNAGCRVILEFSGSLYPSDPTALGESLAMFVDLGGRVVTATWADNTGNLDGRYVTQYMPFTMQHQSAVGGAMATVHDPLHPIMDGVSTLAVIDYLTGNTHSTLRSANCVCLAEWDSGNLVVAAYLDSAGVRLASIGFVPFTFYSGATGDWARLLTNAILWVWPGMPVVGVTAPDTGDAWTVGTTHDITWTAAGGPIVRDSIVYSNDDGATWNFVDKYNGSRTSYTWTIPNSPSADCYVKVFAWNATGSARGVSGKFAIQATGIEQPEKSDLPRAFALDQPWPNPSAAGAEIRFALPRPAEVELGIYDATGSLVRRLIQGAQPAGYRRAGWNGRDALGRRVATGVYYCRLEAGDFVATQKLVVRR